MFNRLDYEVSCPTLDGLVQLAVDTEGVYGAKMMSGGGTLTLVIWMIKKFFRVLSIIKVSKKNFFLCTVA